MSLHIFRPSLAQSGDAGGCSDGAFCDWVRGLTGSDGAADVADWLVNAPLRVAILLFGGWLLNRLVRRSISRFAFSLQRTAREVGERAPGTLFVGERDVRLDARTETVSSVLGSITTVVLGSVVAMLVLGEIGVALGPLLASAGVAGVAIGFGAQSIVKDFLSGLFMIIEDQYGVGDIIDVGDAAGTVEQVGLRTTRVRDINGTVWFFPNGEIRRVANYSQYYAKALIDVDVAYDADLRRAIAIIEQTAVALYEEDQEGEHRLLEGPEVLGVQTLGSDGVSIRVVVTTKPSEQFPVERELRLRLKEALDEAGIEIPFPQRVVWLRSDGSAGDDAPEHQAP